MMLVSACAVLAAVNLLKNPSFDDWPDGEPIPRHWKCDDLNATAPRVSRLHALGTDGPYALRYTNAKQEESIYQDVDVTPGKYYNVTCDARCDTHMYGFEIFTHFLDKDGKSLGVNNRDADNDAVVFHEPWTPMSQYNLLAPPEAVKLRLIVTANDSWSHRSVIGTIDVDNCSVTESTSVVPDRPVRIVPTDALEIVATDLKPGCVEAGVLVRAGAKPVAFRLLAESPIGGGKAIVGGEKTVSLGANEERSVFLPLETADPETRLTVFVGNDAVWQHRFAKDEFFMRLDILDKYDVRKDEIFIPNDARWLNNFPIQRTSRDPVPARLFFEAPVEIEIYGVKWSDYGETDHPFVAPLAVKESVWNGVKTKVYELHHLYNPKNPNWDPLIIMKSHLPEGTVVKTRGWMTWKGGRQVPQEFTAKTVSFGRIKPFERMNSRLCDMTLNWMWTLSDDPVRELPSLGLNALAIKYEPDKVKFRYDGGTKSYAEKMREFVDAAKASGVKWYFYTPNELSFNCWYTNSWNNHANMTYDPTAAYRDIDGGLYKFCGYVPPCPTYRGRNFKKEARWILDCGAMKDFGVTWLALDWEHWSLPCYCERCRRIFREKYCPERGLPDFGDPHKFMREELKHPEAAKAWRDFLVYSRGQVYVDLKKELDKGLDPNRKDWCSPFPGRFVTSDWSRPRAGLVGAIDQFEWLVGFRHPKHLLDETDRIYTNLVAGTTARAVNSTCPMQGCEICYNDPPVATYYGVLEGASLGFIGFEHYYARILDAMSWKYMMDGMRAIRPFEDVIMDGTVTARGEGTDCLWRRIALRDEALYCVRNYELEKPKTVFFEVTAKGAAAAYDSLSGEKLADLKPGTNRIPVALDADHQCKLVYVGPRFAARRAAVRVAAPAPARPQQSFLRKGDVWVMDGDSITYNDTYRQVVLATLAHEHPDCGIRVMNAAVWGQLTEEAGERGARLNPTVASIMLGVNDIIHHDYPAEFDFSAKTAAYVETMRKLVRTYKARGAAVVLMKPVCPDETESSYFGVQRTARGAEAYGKALERLAAEENCALLPIASDFESSKRRLGNKETFIADGVHPLGHGQYELAKSLIERLGLARPLCGADAPRLAVQEGPLSTARVTVARTAALVPVGAPVDLTLAGDEGGEILLKWTAHRGKKSVTAEAAARGETRVTLKKGEPVPVRLALPAAARPDRDGESSRIYITIRRGGETLSRSIVDLAQVPVFDISSGTASGTVPGVGSWKVEVKGRDLWVSGETFACAWPKRPENDVWMNSSGMNGLQTFFDFRPSDRFAENRYDHDTGLVFLNVLEDPWSVMPYPFVGRCFQNCLRAHAEKTEKGFTWRFGFRGRLNDFTPFDVSALDHFGAQIIFQTYDGKRFNRAQVGPQLEDGKVRIDPTFFLSATPVFDRRGDVPKPSAVTVSAWTL